MAPTYLPTILKRRRTAEAPRARPLFRAIRKRKGAEAAFRRRCEADQAIIERHVHEELEAMADLAARNERWHKCGERPARSFIGCGDLLPPELPGGAGYLLRLLSRRRAGRVRPPALLVHVVRPVRAGDCGPPQHPLRAMR